MHKRPRVKMGSLTAKLIAYADAAYRCRGYVGAREAHLRALQALGRRGLWNSSPRQMDPVFYERARDRFHARPRVG